MHRNAGFTVALTLPVTENGDGYGKAMRRFRYQLKIGNWPLIIALHIAHCPKLALYTSS